MKLDLIPHGLTTSSDSKESQKNAAPLLDSLLKNLPGMAYRCLNSKDWPMEFVSDGCYALCGYDRRDIEEQKVLWGECFTLPEDVERIEKEVTRAVEKGEPFEIEYRITTRDNQEKWVWERGRSVEWRDGYHILEGFITDITDRKLAETALMNEEAFAKALVDTVVEAVITIDEAGRIDTINSVTQEMFGYKLDEIKDKHIRILMSEPNNEEFVKYMSSHLSGEESSVANEREDNCKRKDGSIFPVNLSVREVISVSNKSANLNFNHKVERKFVGLIRDLTARRSAEQEAREQREQLAHVDRLNILGEMAISIAHEINQPLTAISMYAQSGIRFIDSGTSKIDRVSDALNKISIQAHRAGDVIEHIQQLTKQQDSRHQETNCNDLISDVHKLAEVEAQLRNMKISLELSDKLKQVRCDPIQIQQVILNLLRNGMESMEGVGFESANEIIVQTNPTEKGIKISITDSGVGITKEFAERLYMPFSSTKESGMGMGLSISNSIVKAHSSKLDFINNKKAGVTFFFTLPYVEDVL
ncbi:MAG: PAS domain S-box protein [Cocleimonas sp.]